MQTYEELISRWKQCNGGQLKVDHEHPLDLYLNINANGNRELLIPVPRPIEKFNSTEAIGVTNYKNKSSYYFAVELLDEQLLKEFAYLCFDLIQSSKLCSSSTEARIVLFQTFQKWYNLLAAVRLDILSKEEIRGLMGEIKYILDEIDAGHSGADIINAWMIHKDASRDFIFDDTWSEVKTIQSSADYVSISSIEQLDHDNEGTLIVYRADKVNEKTANTFTLNSIVKTARDLLDPITVAEFNKKLLAKGYFFHEQYDLYILAFKNRTNYLVDHSFPRLQRQLLPQAVSAAKYDLLLSEIKNWSI